MKHPCRVLITGKSQTGKTTEAVDLIKTQFAKQTDIFIAICPTFRFQKTYDPIRHLVRDACIYTDMGKDIMERVYKHIKELITKSHENKLPPPRICLIIDDCAGTGLIHGNRRGTFSNLSVQSTWWNLSIIAITQQPSSIDPNFRDNAEHILVFPSEREDDLTWLKKSYNGAKKNTNFVELVEHAWRGGRNDEKEWGQHFLYILSIARSHSIFFIDFNVRIE
jgi:hypothetical protein